MSDQSQGPGWWQASDGKWYAPELHPARAGRPHQLPPPTVPVHYGYPLVVAPQRSNGCVIALAVVGGLVVLGFVVLIALGVFAASELDGDVNPAGRPNGVEMTLVEFDEIQNGMTLAQVEKIVGGEGALMSTAGNGAFETALYTWEGSGTFGANANVTFQGGEVIGKAQFGLR